MQDASSTTKRSSRCDGQASRERLLAEAPDVLDAQLVNGQGSTLSINGIQCDRDMINPQFNQ